MQLHTPTGSIALLTVPGRRTGQPRSTPVNLHVEDGRRYLVCPYGHVNWVQICGQRAAVLASRPAG